MIESAKYANISLQVECHNNTALTKHRKTYHKLTHINTYNFLENEYFSMIQKTTEGCFEWDSVTCIIFLKILIFKGEITEKLSLATKILKVG